jgi:hypothetical protein
MEETRICLKCKIPKELSEFPKDKSKPHYGGYDCYCKECKRAKVKKHYKSNKESKIAKVKQWQKDNPEKYKSLYEKQNKSDYHEQYYNDNRDKIIKNSVAYNKKHYEIKPKMSVEERKISKTFRDRVRKAIKTNRKSSIKLLGCSVLELKIYIESQFKPEMNWLNYGKIWEIDHIEGCCNFDFNKQSDLDKCFHYTNLRPLFKTTKIAENFGYKDIIGNRNRKKR